MVAATRTPTGGQQIDFAPRFWPRQWEALQLLGLVPGGPRDGQPPVEELLFGGQAGGGKSFLLRQIAYAICLRWDGAQVRLFRRTYPELEEYLIPRALEEVPGDLATYSATQHELVWRNGSRLRFLHANRDEEVLQYKTAEWAALLIDQAEDFSPYQLSFLRHRVRQPVTFHPGSYHRIIVYSANPGGLSHAYLRDQFVEAPGQPQGSVWTAPRTEGGLRRCFLPARLSDNPSLDAEEYRTTLSGLPPHLVRAYLEGDWSVIAGAFFEQFRAADLDGKPWHVWPETTIRERYQIPADKPFPPVEWPKWAGVDGGLADPWVVEWLTRAPDRRLFVYRETSGRRVEIPDQARTIVDICRRNDEKLAALLCDPAMWATRANLSVSDIDVYTRSGIARALAPQGRLRPGNNRREQGWRRVSEALSHVLDDGYPELVMMEGACPKLQRTLPLLLVDPLKREDVSQQHGRADPSRDDTVRDDFADALRYGITPSAAADPGPRRVELRAELHGDGHYDAGLGHTGVQSEW